MRARTLLKISGVIVCLIFALIMLLSFFENSLVYPAPKGGKHKASNFGAENVGFESSDGTQLHGWYVDRGAPTSLLFFHGNAESVEHTGPGMAELSQLLNSNIFLFDYRGYGKSEGTPSQDGLTADGVAAAHWLRARSPNTAMVYLGRSLGGGVAAQVTKQLPPQGLILVSTFSSMVNVGADMMPFLPVRLLMKNRYDSAEALSGLKVPLFQIHGDADRIVPIKFGKALHDACKTTKSFLLLEGKGHNNIYLGDHAEAIRGFLDSLSPEADEASR